MSNPREDVPEPCSTEGCETPQWRDGLCKDCWGGGLEDHRPLPGRRDR